MFFAQHWGKKTRRLWILPVAVDKDLEIAQNLQKVCKKDICNRHNPPLDKYFFCDIL